MLDAHGGRLRQAPGHRAEHQRHGRAARHQDAQGLARWGEELVPRHVAHGRDLEIRERGVAVLGRRHAAVDVEPALVEVLLDALPGERAPGPGMVLGEARRLSDDPGPGRLARGSAEEVTVEVDQRGPARDLQARLVHEAQHARADVVEDHQTRGAPPGVEGQGGEVDHGLPGHRDGAAVVPRQVEVRHVHLSRGEPARAPGELPRGRARRGRRDRRGLSAARVHVHQLAPLEVDQAHAVEHARIAAEAGVVGLELLAPGRAREEARGALLLAQVEQDRADHLDHAHDRVGLQADDLVGRALAELEVLGALARVDRRDRQGQQREQRQQHGGQPLEHGARQGMDARRVGTGL